MTTWFSTPARRLAPLVALGLAAGLVPRPAAAEIIEEIAARVNDAIIARSELQSRREQVARQILAEFEGESAERLLNEAQDSVLFDMINEELLIQQAKLNFDMDKYFGNLKSQFKETNEITSDRELEELLRGEGITQDEFRRMLLRGNVPRDVLQFEVARKISVSPAEIEAYYADHQSEFARPGEVTLREIVILEEPRGRDEARTLAEDLLTRHAAGEDFAELAREYSESASKDRGGLTGPFRTGDLAPILEMQAFELPVGGVGEPISTSYGFHLIKVEERTETSVAALSEVTDQIEGTIRQQKYAADVEAYLQRLWKENQVVVSPRYAVGRLADGGPYATLEEILPRGTVLGAPDAEAPAGTSAEPSSAPGAPAGSSPGQ
jgi:parvulin-like peptidyl-prolyl isomerase